MGKYFFRRVLDMGRGSNEPLLHTQKKLPLLKMICTPFLVVQKGGYISQIAAAFSAEKSYII
jgi:hypothetical protein